MEDQLFRELAIHLSALLSIEKTCDDLLAKFNTSRPPAKPEFFETEKDIEDYQTKVDLYNRQYESNRSQRELAEEARHQVRHNLWCAIPIVDVPFKIKVGTERTYLVTKTPETYHNKGNVIIRRVLLNSDGE